MADARRFPERMRDFAWINSDLVPPCPFVARTMHRAVVDATERHRELIARLSADRARLLPSAEHRLVCCCVRVKS
jgi:hypothetical protein